MLLINEINHLTKDVNFSCGHDLTSFHSLSKAAALGSVAFHSRVRAAKGTALVWEPRPELLSRAVGGQKTALEGRTQYIPQARRVSLRNPPQSSDRWTPGLLKHLL